MLCVELVSSFESREPPSIIEKGSVCYCCSSPSCLSFHGSLVFVQLTRCLETHNVGENATSKNRFHLGVGDDDSRKVKFLVLEAPKGTVSATCIFLVLAVLMFLTNLSRASIHTNERVAEAHNTVHDAIGRLVSLCCWLDSETRRHAEASDFNIGELYTMIQSSMNKQG